MITKEFNYEPFFGTYTWKLEKGELSTVISSFPFYFDLTEYQAPWLQFEIVENDLIRLSELQLEEVKLLRKRNDQAQLHLKMTLLIALYIDFMFWANGQKVCQLGNGLFTDVGQLTYKPYNCGERLTFVLENIIHFQAIVQLEHLFSEQRKKNAKMKIVKESTRKK
ncbi:YpoC family protein [Halalkalibacter sp. APA_J-10(15)]|uniref:YpoC family protein n=1 Tax=unclassified Halalkalibacter TaxID=2893063 RepID=UPI001FF553E0|nr:hypothetical protein [Halalkalibacter sp. APA_J-10(15)]MCK0472077.1 hypothetical protein [Halalkalibacter sp. APA_J-10(15)]